MSLTLFHATHDPEAILVAGFVDGDGSAQLGAANMVGVVLSATPIRDESGDFVLAVTLPDSVDLAAYEFADEGRTAWCVPAVEVNASGVTRLLSEAELDVL
jgi:hypothetical protein